MRLVKIPNHRKWLSYPLKYQDKLENKEAKTLNEKQVKFQWINVLFWIFFCLFILHGEIVNVTLTQTFHHYTTVQFV